MTLFSSQVNCKTVCKSLCVCYFRSCCEISHAIFCPFFSKCERVDVNLKLFDMCQMGCLSLAFFSPSAVRQVPALWPSITRLSKPWWVFYRTVVRRHIFSASLNNLVFYNSYANQTPPIVFLFLAGLGEEPPDVRRS